MIQQDGEPQNRQMLKQDMKMFSRDSDGKKGVSARQCV